MKVRAALTRSFAVLAVAVASATPAAADDTEPSDPPAPPVLAGSTWRFVDTRGTVPPATIQPTLSLSEDGAVGGFSGCNRYFGRYTLVGADLSFSELGSTKMWCGPEPMEVEGAVQAVLHETSRVAVTPTELTLLASDDTVLAHLVPVTPAPSP